MFFVVKLLLMLCVRRDFTDDNNFYLNPPIRTITTLVGRAARKQVSNLITSSLNARSSLRMLWYRLVFVLMAKVDIFWWKGKSECRILRGLPASRINCRLQRFAASWIHLSANRPYCFYRARFTQFKLFWFHWVGPMAPKTLQIGTLWIITCGVLCWRNITICDQSQKR